MPEEDFKLEIIGDIAIEKVNLLRATLNEAQFFKNRLLLDSINGYNKIIVDLSSCIYVDSTMIGAMVFVSKKISEKGGELKIVIPKKETFQVFTIKGLFSAFNLYETIDEALKDF
jgi:anti-anti-sigma factor